MARDSVEFMPGVDVAAIEARHSAQFAVAQGHPADRREALRTAQRLELLMSCKTIRGTADIRFLLENSDLKPFKGFHLGAQDISVFKARHGDISEGFYVYATTGLFKYPEAFTVTQTLPVVREDPLTPTLDDLGSWSPSEDCYLIGKIMADARDTVRLVFADPESQVIKLIAANSCNERDYNALDVGNLVTIGRKTGYSAWGLPQGYNSKIKIPGLHAELKARPLRSAEGYPNSAEAYDSIRENYMADFIKGKYKEIQLKCFRFARHGFSYSDTVIDCSWLAVRKAMQIVAESYNSDFTSLFPEILKGAQGLVFRVNGTQVRVDVRESKAAVGAAKLTYVNGYRISAPDLTEVLEHSLCFPKATKVYDDYLKTVSRVSLKFHRAVARGVPFYMPESCLEIKALDGTAIRRPGGMQNSGGHVSITLNINKTFGRKSSFDFLGTTRYIDEFDTFLRIAAGTLTSGKLEAQPKIQQGLPHAKFVRRLQNIDTALVAGSAMLPALDIGMADVQTGAMVPDPSRYSGTTWDQTACTPHMAILNNAANAEKINALYSEFCEAFKSGMTESQRILERSHGLLQQVMKDTGATCVEADGDFYYKVTGLSGVRYKVQESNAAVHLDSEGSEHICIVKASNDIDGYDYISSLLMALSQDKFTARKIHTLEGHVNRAQRREAA